MKTVGNRSRRIGHTHARMNAADNRSGHMGVLTRKTPDGNIIAKAGADEELLLADIDFDRVRRARDTRPYLNLRRPEFYA